MTRVNLILGLALLVALGVAMLRREGWQAQGEMIQTTTAAGEVDRCITCHRETLPRTMARGSTKKHPAIKGHPDLTRFGCTPCHGGQGRRLDRTAHTPALGQGPEPFLRRSQIQARCARCHVPTNLDGAQTLNHGFREYLDAACSGCHRPGRRDEGLGPDLRRLGRRTEAELRDALLRPRESHAGASMWSLGWRYDKKVGTHGPGALDALIVALLAMNDDPGPYRSAWYRPTLRVDLPCASCHQEVIGGQTGGPPHRCTLLRRKEGLRCRACHDQPATRVKSTRGPCPAVQQAGPQCAICHLRPGDGASR